MTERLADIVAYLCAKYPHKSELSNARLTKLVYLADWKSTQDSGSQVSSIDWVFNNYGPWVPDVIDAAGADSRFQITTGVNAYGSPRTTVTLDQDAAPTVDKAVSLRTARVLDLVIAETEAMYFNPFIRYVYDTLPVRSTPKGSALPLQQIRREHPESHAPLPEPVIAGTISADTYVFIRNQLMQAAANRFFDSDWLTRTDPPLEGTSALLPGLIVRGITLDPNLQARRMSSGVSVAARGTIDAGAEVPPGTPPPAGYTVDEEDIDAWSNTVQASLPFTVAAYLVGDGRTQRLSVTAVNLQLPA